MSEAKPAPRCALCGGDLVPGHITTTTELGDCVLVVRDVPATVCDQCGEEWLTHAMVTELHRLAEDARSRGAVVEVLQMAS